MAHFPPWPPLDDARSGGHHRRRVESLIRSHGYATFGPSWSDVLDTLKSSTTTKTRSMPRVPWTQQITMPSLADSLPFARPSSSSHSQSHPWDTRGPMPIFREIDDWPIQNDRRRYSAWIQILKIESRCAGRRLVCRVLSMTSNVPRSERSRHQRTSISTDGSEVFDQCERGSKTPLAERRPGNLLPPTEGGWTFVKTLGIITMLLHARNMICLENHWTSAAQRWLFFLVSKKNTTMSDPIQ
ncbi:hypothetical protein BD324DRAFT_309645 [Kockovaella imperatae]|uniref:Uncharacterized protein n=1 Tax=Kockovaella imperatae TaxID=4999 RepID=A0A1Y1UNI2_9TREE|nr:hypothetical protein BD324DRAFT_309645 [Kockovaella imperatae]ORX39077.1 hypothetical protein BD324DRAFT_309645 [Kockovaella imperatae]